MLQPLTLSVEHWKGLIDANGAWLQHCCGNISDARDALIESLLASAEKGDYGIIQDARYGEADECSLTTTIQRLREGATLSLDNARVIVLNAGTHDVIEEAFFPEKSDGSPSWATSEDSPWPTIVEACRALVGDFSEVVGQ